MHIKDVWQETNRINKRVFSNKIIFNPLIMRVHLLKISAHSVDKCRAYFTPLKSST